MSLDAGRSRFTQPRAGCPIGAMALWSLALSFVLQGGAAGADMPERLALGERVTRELDPGATQAFRVAVPAGRGLKAVAAQESIDVTLSLLASDGTRLVDDDARSSGDEVLLWIPASGGEYEIRVSPSNAKAPGGRYVLSVESPLLDDSGRTALQRHVDGRALVKAGREKFPAAQAAFEEARTAWTSRGDAAMEAHTIYQLAWITRERADLDSAIALYGEAAQRFEALERPADRALALNGMGIALANQGDYRTACDRWKLALELKDSLTPADRVSLLYNYGDTIVRFGEYAESLDAMRSAEASFHDLGMRREELLAVSELARVHVMRRDVVSSLEELNRGLALSRQYARPDLEARFHQDLGLVYEDVGDGAMAVEEWKDAIALHRTAGNRVAEGATLLQVGDHARVEGDLDGAAARYDEALALFRAAGSKAGEMRANVRLGAVLSRRGEYARAIELQESAVEYSRSTGDHQGEVSALLSLARTLAASGDRARARALLSTALSLSRDAAGFSEVEILGETALLERDGGDLRVALGSLETVLGMLEAKQGAVLVPSLRASAGGDAQRWYREQIEVLMRLYEHAPEGGWSEKAAEAAERARARSLLSLLGEAKVDLGKGVEPQLLGRYRDLQARLAAKDAPASRRSGGPSLRGSGAGQAEREKELADVSSQMHAVEAEIRRTSPAVAALVQPDPIGLAAIRERVLDDRTVLLEFALGKTRSFLWAVTRDDLFTATLPASSEIEKAARKVHDGLCARPGTNPTAAVEKDLAALGSLILGPVADRLAGVWKRHRLAIVATGALEYVPFAALRVPSTPPAGRKPSPRTRRLVEEHEVVSLPSASVLDLLRREEAGRRPAPLPLALFGDPVFEATDPRVDRKPGAPAGGPARELSPELLRATHGATARGGLARLPFSRAEVDAIGALVPSKAVLRATDFRASRDLAVGGALARYRILHFATHALLNTEHPELSGLVLSLVDEHGRPKDGFLRLQDVYGLKLNADLVVLSACRSALGREIAGEGLVGLTRGFMYAGAPRVVASLWPVDDVATAALMGRFYRGMLRDGLRPAAALRAAQEEMLRQKRWAAPYYWAAFTLQGDWN